MVKKAFLLFTAAACLGTGLLKAQTVPHCFTDEVTARAKAAHPEIAVTEAQLKAQIDAALGKMNLAGFKVTAQGAWDDTVTLHVPIVFHVIHNYNGSMEYISDDVIYQELDNINRLYRGANSDTNQVISTYKGNIPGTNIKYIANTHIQFHLAQKDPMGNPTNGITRRRDFTTRSAGDHAKFDVWQPASYLNIWIVALFDNNHTGAAAYALKPPSGNATPWYDGPITSSQAPLNNDNTIGHEIGHSLNLDHPWGGTNSPEVTCGDDDVDDTPPTDGHDPAGCNAADNYDTKCIYTDAIAGKFKIEDQAFKAYDNVNGRGIRFKTLEKVNLDRVSIYPADSGKQFTIALKHKNASGNYVTVKSYTGTTLNNKRTDSTSLGLQVIDFVDDAAAVSDTLNGLGITFRLRDTLVLRSVRFFPDTAAVNHNKSYEIVLKRNGVIIDSYTGAVSSFPEKANLNFPIHYVDTNAVYSLEFAHNPGVKRRPDPNTSYRNIPGVIRFVSDTAQGRYNYFYSWNVYTFDFSQEVPVMFLMPIDTQAQAYSIEFTNNPGAGRDLGSVSGIQNQGIIGNVLYLTHDVAPDGYYNYFYKWQLRYGDYFVQYPAATANNLFNVGATSPWIIDYPDTVNAQNVMDYTYCSKMFTYLQGVRMRAALRSNIALRNNLIDTANLIATGVMNANGTIAARADLPPVADFSTRAGNVTNNDLSKVNEGFTCAGPDGNPVFFTNRSWRDTLSSINWTFSNGASNPTQTVNNPGFNTSTVNTRFTQPGWVTVTMIANSNAGSDTLVSSDRVYIADPNAIDAQSYFGEFTQGSDLDKYPTFNYFNNFTKWQPVTNAGYYDNTSMSYRQMDNRTGTAVYVGTPRGDYDDFMTPAYDFSTFGTSNLYLTFFTSGAFRTSKLSEMNDTLDIFYSSDCGGTWSNLKSLSNGDIGNSGIQINDWTPAGMWDWQAQNIKLPTALATKNKVFFRFRYRPGTEMSSPYFIGTGNNFYLDRIHVGKWTTDVQDLQNKAAGFTLAPNPTSGATTIILKDAGSKTAEVSVTDVTGKLVYRTEASLNANISRIEIPANAIAVKGMYLVTVVTGTQKQTEKLVVY